MRTILFLMIFSFMAFSCNHKQGEGSHDISDNHEHEPEAASREHEHEEVSLQITAYGNNYEVYAEADPFIAGKTSGILAHFSNLPGFRALEEGEVIARITAGGAVESQSLEKPTRKGIYKFELTPSKTGKAVLEFEIRQDGLIRDILEVNTEVFAEEDEAYHFAETEHLSSVNGIVFTKEQSWKIDFATGTVDIGQFGKVIKATARIENSTRDIQMLTAGISGIVEFSGNLPQGMEVGTNEKILSVSGKGMADGNSEVSYRAAQQTYKQAESDYSRLRELAPEKIISEKELLEARTRYEQAKAVYENLEKNFSGGVQKIYSDKGGYIREVFVTNGQFVQAGQALLSISRHKQLLLHAELPTAYVNELKEISDIRIKSNLTGQVFSLDDLNGKIIGAGKSASDDNYLLPVTIEVDGNDFLIPGSFIPVFIRISSEGESISIPNTSLIEEQGNFFVLVQVTPELFEKREIKTGMNDGERTQVVSGLLPGERIVTRGTTIVKLAQSTGTMDAHAGHVH